MNAFRLKIIFNLADKIVYAVHVNSLLTTIAMDHSNSLVFINIINHYWSSNY